MDFEREVVGDAWVSDEAKENLRALCAVGSRFGGTPSEKEAVDYILEKYREYGLENVHAVEFGYKGWIRGEARLEIVSPTRIEMDALQSPPGTEVPRLNGSAGRSILCLSFERSVDGSRRDQR